jgi:hypothetical protein
MEPFPMRCRFCNAQPAKFGLPLASWVYSMAARSEFPGGMSTVSATDLAPPRPRIHFPVLLGILSGAVIR